jgi:hypothetical protein
MLDARRIVTMGPTERRDRTEQIVLRLDRYLEELLGYPLDKYSDAKGSLASRIARERLVDCLEITFEELERSYKPPGG